MDAKTEKIGEFLVIPQLNDHQEMIKTVYLSYIPVAQFNTANNSERRLAVIELVERKLCNQKMAGKLCGFHRNTVHKILRTKKLLGLEEALKDDRGHKEPYKYINNTRAHIKKLIRNNPNWTDSAIAKQASKDLSMSISRSAVGRIRGEKDNKKKR